MGTWSWSESREAGLSIPAGFAPGSADTSRKPLLKQETAFGPAPKDPKSHLNLVHRTAPGLI